MGFPANSEETGKRLYFCHNVISSHGKGNVVAWNLCAHLPDSLLNLLVGEKGEGGGVSPPEPLEPLLLAPLDGEAMQVQLHLFEASLLQHQGDGGAGKQHLLLLFYLLGGIWKGVIEDVVGGPSDNQQKTIWSQFFPGSGNFEIEQLSMKS